MARRLPGGIVTLARYTKSLVPAIGSLFAVLYRWAATGNLDVQTLRLAAVGLAYAAVVYLLPNVAVPEQIVNAGLVPDRPYATGGVLPSTRISPPFDPPAPAQAWTDRT